VQLAASGLKLQRNLAKDGATVGDSDLDAIKLCKLETSLSTGFKNMGIAADVTNETR